MRSSVKSRRGNTVLEFTLVGIPLVFVLISIFEISRGMWIYHTLAHAIRVGSRYAAVHGQNCSVSPNSCAVSVGNIAAVIQGAAVALPTDAANRATRELVLSFCAPPGGAPPTCPVPASPSCTDISQCSCYLTDCLAIATIWPPSGANRVGLDDVEIAGNYPFASAIGLVWPGAHTVNNFPTFRLLASARERVEF